ncbi:MAG: ATP synthase F1 subunit epsilon [Deltaproteobacteria bacterium]|jgi:F-type H+-transporting ATPase subunit epsilon|nr:ATP synthase F1 subunit epsilon [Deltaproteobacteria bacterium]MBW2535916.1 ATP synthase F1 subunit epsilon [Deltaproteobacteria bacterium]
MATEAGIQLEVVTPKGMALSETVEEVIAPSVQGEFGVLPGHLPLLAAMATGLVRYRLSGELHTVAVGAGFVEVNDDHALLLTDRFTVKDDVDVLHVRERLKEVDEELEGWQGDLLDVHRLELIEEEQWLAAQLELIGDPPVPKVIEASRSLDYAALMPTDDDEGGEALDEEDEDSASK